jgi:hypothetical protein
MHIMDRKAEGHINTFWGTNIIISVFGSHTFAYIRFTGKFWTICNISKRIKV